MFSKKIILILFAVLFTVSIYSQKDSTTIKGVHIQGKISTPKKGRAYNPLAPSKAAFYSAIFPGMGQIYNKKYWKAPIVWGALAIPTYYYVTNNSEYQRYRTAFRLRKSGQRDEFTDEFGNTNISVETLENAQEQLRQNRDLSLLSGIVLYVLQIVEASVNAHLLQFNTDDDLTFTPTVIPDPILIDAPRVGLTIKYSF